MRQGKNSRFEERETKSVVASQISVSEAGRRGGQATLKNRGLEHFKKIGQKGGQRTKDIYGALFSEFGKKGGRPRRPILNELTEEENR